MAEAEAVQNEPTTATAAAASESSEVAAQVPQATAPAPANIAHLAEPDEAGGGEEDEEEDDSIADLFHDFIEKVKTREKAISQQEFVAKANKVGTVQVFKSEIRDYVYGFLVELANLGGGHAVAFEHISDRVEDLEEEMERQGILLRTVAANYVNTLALALANLVLSGENPDTQKQVAGEIVTVINQIQKMTAEHLAAIARDVNAAASQTTAPNTTSVPGSAA